MSQLVLNRGINLKNHYLKKITDAVNFESPYFVLASLLVFVALVTVITLVSSARQVTKGYVVNSLEAEHQELLRGSERKELQISQVSALSYIEKSDRVRSMRNPSNVVFVSGETAIASR